MIIIFAGLFRLFARLCDCVCDSQSASVRRGSSAARERPAGRRPAPAPRAPQTGGGADSAVLPVESRKSMAAGAAAARGLARGCLAETRPSFGVTFCDCVSCCTAVHDMQQKNRARQRMCGRIARRMRAGRPPGVRRWRLGAPPRTELYFATSDAPAHEDEMAVQWRTSRVCAEARSTLAVTCRNRAAYMYR